MISVTHSGPAFVQKITDDSAGQPQQVVLTKLSYDIAVSGQCRLAAAPQPILCLGQDYPDRSEQQFVSDLRGLAGYSEVFVTGTAYAKPNHAVAQTSIALVRDQKQLWSKALWVFGPRVWRWTPIGYRYSAPQPFASLPLSYQYAYGGQDFSHNPTGLGYCGRRWRVGGMPLPRIEYAQRLIRRPHDIVAPAGFGPLPQPLLAKSPSQHDLRSSAHNAAFSPQDQRFSESFQPGDQWQLQGFFPEIDKLTLTLPSLVPAYHCQSQRLVIYPECDSVHIDTDARQCHVVWRAALPVVTTPKKEAVIVRLNDHSSRQVA